VRIGRRVVVSLLALTGLACGINAIAGAVPARGTVDPRIRTASYSPDQVYALTGFVGYHLDLEFEEDEEFVGLSAGDPEALTYGAHGHVLTLKPRVATAQMNLTVSTTKRRYYFDYTILNRPPLRLSDDVMYAVRFVYPPEFNRTSEARIAAEFARAQAARPRNFDYWFCGRRSVKPIAASDDGLHTRLTVAPRRELPAVFVANDDGSELLVNFSVEGGEIVVHRVAAKFILRRGKLVGCVVNKGFVGGGEPLHSGTVAPAVIRERRQPATDAEGPLP
jgi:type IV secretion system protein VirB9